MKLNHNQIYSDQYRAIFFLNPIPPQGIAIEHDYSFSHDYGLI